MKEAINPSSAVKAWLDEQEGFGIRRERLYDHLAVTPEAAVAWLETAFRMGMEATAARTDRPKEVAADNGNGVAEYRKDAELARDFPKNTCPASRHMQMMADALAGEGRYPMIEEDPEHVAASIYATIAELWKARTRIAELDAEMSSADKDHPHPGS